MKRFINKKHFIFSTKIRDTLYLLIILIAIIFTTNAQEVPILSYKVDQNNIVQIEVASSADKYYVLNIRHTPTGKFTNFSSMTLGKEGKTMLSESVSAYPKNHYKVLEYAQNKPNDIDKDGIDDMTEFKNPLNQSPFNKAQKINFKDGVVSIDDRLTFKKLSYKGPDVVNLDPHLVELEFVKFYIVGETVDKAYIYFMNTETHRAHGSFKLATKLNTIEGFGLVENEMKGEIVFHPNVKSANGTMGVFRFEFEPNDSFSFEKVQMAYELIATNMPFLKNNLSYYPMPNAALPLYKVEKKLYDASRIPILLEKDLYAAIEYIPLHQAQGYGLLTKMQLNETPNARDIVIYENLPNEMPRTGGIISTVVQTPLSHVNLRAIQDNVPNSFIKDAITNKKIIDLIGKYVHYTVNQANFSIEETTKTEVEKWYENLRPIQKQSPTVNLTFTKILPLDEISFGMSDAFGVKCANVAAMRKFDFVTETIPNGFGVPFYFYRKYMEFNNFYEKLNVILLDSAFNNDITTRIDRLSTFRNEIKGGEMPQWMLDELGAMQNSFPKNTSIRCRSSTNNEDLPNFSGAGLYDSKTQKLTEGHISKSIKQVFASMWNFRAFEERDFNRVDHLAASMAILCHSNFSDEQLNGVAVSTDPFNYTNNTFYLNNQVGEDLVTNPNALSIPEEILLDTKPKTKDNYSIVRFSNLSSGKLILKEKYLSQLSNHLAIIHNKFKALYKQQDNENFAIEIEYKITKEGNLSIKQARPWAGANTSTGNNNFDVANFSGNEEIKLSVFPNPIESEIKINFEIPIDGEVYLQIFESNGKTLLIENIGFHYAGNHLFILENKYFNTPNGVLIANLSVTNEDNKTFQKSIKIYKKGN